MKLGVSSYSFKNFSHEEAISQAKQIGYDAIEFTDMTGNSHAEQLNNAKKLRALADENELEISAYVIRADFAVKDVSSEIKRVCEQVDVAEALGTKNLRHDVMWSYDVFRSFDEALPVIADAARAVTEYAAKKGIRTMSENHGFIAQDSYRMEKLAAAVNHPNYGLLVDIGNFLCVDEDPVRAVSRVANLAYVVHVKDFYSVPFGKTESETVGFMTRCCNRLTGATIGKGVVPISQCLAVLKRAGYDGNVDVEFEGAQNCIDALRESESVLRKILSRI